MPGKRQLTEQANQRQLRFGPAFFAGAGAVRYECAAWLGGGGHFFIMHRHEIHKRDKIQ